MAPTTIHVKATSGAKITLDVELSSTVGDLKTALSASDKADVPAERQRLIYKGHVLKDEKTLESYGEDAARPAASPALERARASEVHPRESPSLAPRSRRRARRARRLRSDLTKNPPARARPLVRPRRHSNPPPRAQVSRWSTRSIS